MKNRRSLNVVKDFHDICQKCVPEVTEKYEGMTSRGEDPFRVLCGFIPKDEDLLPTNLFKDFTQEEIDLARSMFDAVQWAKDNLIGEDNEPFIPRWYQEELLRCSSRRIAVRAARRIGKCLTENTRIFTRSGALYSIKDLVGRVVEGTGINPESHSILRYQKLSVTENIVQEVKRVVTMSGRSIEASLEHPFLTRKGWIETGELRVGQRIAVPGLLSWSGVSEIDDEKVKLIAYILGDGGVTQKSVRVTNTSRAIIEDLQDIASYFSVNLYTSPGDPKEHSFSLKEEDFGYRKNPVKEYLVGLDLMGKSSHSKSVPQEIFRLTRPKLALFLSRLLACDGWACVASSCGKTRAEIGYASVNKRLAEDVQHLLLRFGISSSITWKKTSKLHGIWQLAIRKHRDISRFLKHLTIFSKEAALQAVKDWLGERYLPTEAENVVWDEIVSIESLGKQQTYSVSVLNRADYDLRNFVANDIYSHNTVTLAVIILHTIYTKAHRKVIIFGPQKVHVEEIHNRVMGFIERSPKLRNSIRRSVKSPIFEIELENGSRVRGFASGDSGKKEGLSLRGQDGHLIILDEAAYIDSETISKAVIPILNTFPDARLIAASTPSGNKDKFYEWSQNDAHFKEFYHPSAVLPHWEQIEAEVKHEYRDKMDDYYREILALHGVAEGGVYRGDLVSASLRDFKYEDMVPEESRIYSIGVDWNKTAGTEICIVGWDKFKRDYLVGPCINIPMSEFTQLSAIEKLIDLIDVWRPQFVYVDQGYGSSSVELLKAIGLRSVPMDGYHHKLNEIMKDINFSSKIDVRDPNTGEIVKKDLKPFMVENSVRRFEDSDIRVSVHDSYLQRQLGSYVIKSVSVTGRPVYGSIEKRLGDHRLDAMNLALLAYKLEMSDFSPNTAKSVNTFRPGHIAVSDLNSIYRSEDTGSVVDKVARAPSREILKPQTVSITGGPLKVLNRDFDPNADEPNASRYERQKPISPAPTRSRMAIPSRRGS